MKPSHRRLLLLVTKMRNVTRRGPQPAVDLMENEVCHDLGKAVFLGYGVSHKFVESYKIL